MVGSALQDMFGAVSVQPLCGSFFEREAVHKNGKHERRHSSVVKTLRACDKKTGASKRLSANIIADDPFAGVVRWQACLVAV
jgi:hypothetical protein